LPRQRNPLDPPLGWQGLNSQAANDGMASSSSLTHGSNNNSGSFFGGLGFAATTAPAVDADDAAAADLNIDSFFSTLAPDSSLMGEDHMPSLGGFGPPAPASEAGSGGSGSDGGLGLGLGASGGGGGSGSDYSGALKSPSDRLAAIAGGLFDGNRDQLGGHNGFGAIGTGSGQPPPGLGSGLGGFAGGFGSVLRADNSHSNPLRDQLGGAELSSSLGGAAALNASPAAAGRSRFGFALSGTGGSFSNEDELLGLTSTTQAAGIGTSGVGSGGGGGGGQNGMRDYHQGVEEMDFLSGGNFFGGKQNASGLPIGGNQVSRGSAFFDLPGSGANDESEALGGLSQASDGDHDNGNEDDPAWA
jgi:hypothetical protein